MSRSMIVDEQYSLDCNGNHGGVIIPNSPSLNPTDYVALYIRVRLTPGVVCILFDNSQGGATFSYFCSVDGAGQLSFFSVISGVSRNIINAKAPYRPNEVNDYSFIYNGQKIAIYANKELVAELICSGTLGVNTGPLRVAQYHSGVLASRGLVSIAKIFHTNNFTFNDHLLLVNDKELSNEITDTCVLNLNIANGPGSGSSVPDLSPAGNHGTFTRASWSTSVSRKARDAITDRVSVDGRVSAADRVPILADNDPRNIENLIDIRGWFEADFITGLDDLALVSSWDDASGNNNHITATGALRPTYQKLNPAHLLNGLPTVSFNGSNSLKVATGFPGQPCTVYLVARINIEPWLQALFDGLTGNSTSIYRSGSTVKVYAGSVMGNLAATGTPWRIYTAVFNNSQSVCGIGPLEVIGNAGLNSTVGITMGSFADNSAGLNGNFAALIVSNGADDSSKRRFVRRYLAAKWGV